MFKTAVSQMTFPSLSFIPPVILKLLMDAQYDISSVKSQTAVYE